ncbi:molybdopterin/thiamine biosynthesis adenylyltransferase/rhodanese-related sulfurtransferase [Paraburkholderia sp. GAS199]|uniref:molybdopterin-synthase adenylyltransferase MoeB n=1 Tax=Paraburkholderia sp. GAS199 TaxID=3035126 RepID=UPI003D24F840
MTPKILNDFLIRTRNVVPEISVADAQTMLLQSVPLFDVREESETEQGVIPGACVPGRSFLEMKVAEQIPHPASPIVLYCASGVRSMMAAASLRALGYVSVMSLAGGLSAWKAAGLSVEKPSTLTSGERKRYARQLILPQVGVAGQEKLKGAKVLVIGAGGLGAPCLLYLAAAGVGSIGIVDHDVIDISNLQRQVIYSTDDIGRPKAEVAREVLMRMNPDLRVSEFAEKLDPSNALRICSDFDVVVDCTDNFSARYLINDTALSLCLPIVHGSVFQFEGQVALLNSQGGPCYRCIYPEAPPAEIAPSCSEAGVMGVVPGLIGLLQAAKVIKVILGIEADACSALVYHGLDDTFSQRKLHKRLTCACGRARTAPAVTPTASRIELESL